jgi:hypothetical protein
METKYDGVLKELAALLVPHLIAHPDVQAMLTEAHCIRVDDIEKLVQTKIDALGPIDKDMVREVCEEVIDAQDIDDKINDWFTCNFDISDYQSEIVDMIEMDDAIETHLNTYLHDEVVTVVQGLTFNVEVSSI